MNIKDKYELLAKEWDHIAAQRFSDLIEGKDRSYSETLKPNMIGALRSLNLSSVLDIGCGVGVFTEEVGKIAKKVSAFDVSCKSIEIANRNSSSSNISYTCLNFLDFNTSERFTTILSNMALMTIPELPTVFRQVEKLLAEGGTFLFSITHPSFWPMYWDYDKGDFNYNVETEIIRDFKIQNKTYSNLQTRHYHRPISTYLNLLISIGLTLTDFIELRGINEKFWYPRFLIIAGRRMCQ